MSGSTRGGNVSRVGYYGLGDRRTCGGAWYGVYCRRRIEEVATRGGENGFGILFKMVRYVKSIISERNCLVLIKME